MIRLLEFALVGSVKNVHASPRQRLPRVVAVEPPPRRRPSRHQRSLRQPTEAPFDVAAESHPNQRPKRRQLKPL
jgi:hypothetical protein